MNKPNFNTHRKEAFEELKRQHAIVLPTHTPMLAEYSRLMQEFRSQKERYFEIGDNNYKYVEALTAIKLWWFNLSRDERVAASCPENCYMPGGSLSRGPGIYEWGSK